MSDSFNTPDIDDVLQEDVPDYRPTEPVDVCVKDSVRVKELPTIIGPCKNYIIGATDRAYRILDRNPLRKCATITIINGDVCIGGTPAECGDAGKYVGAVLSGGIQQDHKYGFQSELWALGVNVNVAGTSVVLEAPTDAVLVSVVEEFWAR